MPRASFTEILLGTTTLTEEQLERAQDLSVQKGLQLEEVLLQQRFITDDELCVRKASNSASITEGIA